MAELMAKSTGCCKGKGGSMHVGGMAVGMFPAIAIVGAGAPIAVGAALSAKMRGTDQVVASFFGEGGANEGAVHEGMGTYSAPSELDVARGPHRGFKNLYAVGTVSSKVAPG